MNNDVCREAFNFLAPHYHIGAEQIKHILDLSNDGKTDDSSQIENKIRDLIVGASLVINPLPTQTPNLFFTYDPAAMAADWQVAVADMGDVWTNLCHIGMAMEHLADASDEEPGRDRQSDQSKHQRRFSFRGSVATK